MRKGLVWLIIAVLIGTLVGCAGNSKLDVAHAVEVRMAPATSSVPAGGTLQFTATAIYTTNPALTWKVNDVAGGNAAVGTITNNGLYTAPATVPSPATVTVKATSVADSSASATATVTITAPQVVAVSVSPTTADVEVSKTATFTATVTGSTNKAVTWSVVGGDTNGTITSAGVYTAPATVPNPATVTVKAISQADNTKSATATVTVKPAPVQAVTVAVTPKTASVVTGGTQQFTATVANATDATVTWKVNNIAGGDVTVGTITDKGLYTAPATVPAAAKPTARKAAGVQAGATADVTITAVSNEDSTVSGTATVTISEPAPPAVTISPKTADVAVNGTQQFSATVTGTSDTAVDWTIEGCDSCGTIDTNGKYTAPATVPASSVTIKVALHADATVFDTATVTVKTVDANAAKLNGTYVFLFSGYKGQAEIDRIGKFTADGAGAITGGEMKVQQAGQHTGSGTLTGTYTVFNDNRGEMTLTMGASSIKYRFVLKANGNGRFIEFDETDVNGMHGSGEFKKQDATSLEGLAADNYVLAVAGSLNAADRMGIMAQFTADSSVASVTGEVDYVTAGDYSKHGNATVKTQKVGADNLYITITPQGDRAYKFFVYLSSADQGYVMVDNSAGNTESQYMTGQYRKQSGTFTKASLNGPVVFQLGGYDLDPGDRTKTGLGQIAFDGNGAFTGHIDQNDISDPQPYQMYDIHGDYTVSANGRVQGNIFVGPSPQSIPLIFYLYGPNKGFLMDGVRTTAVVKDVNTGTIEPQTGGPFNSISGTFTVTSTDTFTEFVRMPIGTVTVAADGTFTGTMDHDVGTLYPDQIINGTYTVTDAAFGRSTMQVVMPDHTVNPLVLYSVSPTKFYGILIDPDNDNEVVLTFEQ